MKKIRLPFLSLLLILFIFSCENEALEGFDLENENTSNPSGSGENGAINNVTEETTTGDYWPRALDNEWNYNSTAYGNVVYRMISTETISGLDYYKFDQLFGAQAWMRKSGDVYYTRQIVSGFPIQGYEIDTTPLEIALLKDGAQVGETWNVDVDYSITYNPVSSTFPSIPNTSISVIYNFEMIARDLSRVVEGVEYVEVLHVRLTLVGEGITDTADYYYAKNVGLIEFTGSADSSKLLSYALN